MITRRFLARAGAMLGAFALMGVTQRDCVYRYRLTIAVDTPEGVKSGASVLELAASETQTRVHYKLKGEAVAIDLGARGVLFAILAGRDRTGGVGSERHLIDLPAKVETRAGKVSIDDPNFFSYLVNSRDRIELKRAEIPFLARFRDIADPTSVEAVDPGDLAKSFGPGVTLKGAAIEMTADPVTTGIEKRLGWVTNSQIMKDPGWAKLPRFSREVINGLFTGTPEEHFR